MSQQRQTLPWDSYIEELVAAVAAAAIAVIDAHEVMILQVVVPAVVYFAAVAEEFEVEEGFGAV